MIWDVLRARNFVSDPSVHATVESNLAAGAVVNSDLRDVDDHRNAALRGALTPLKKLAERLGAAVVLVSHLSLRERRRWAGVASKAQHQNAHAKSQVPRLREEWGAELFYNVWITPGCHLTTELHLLPPGLAPVNAALLFVFA